MFSYFFRCLPILLFSLTLACNGINTSIKTTAAASSEPVVNVSSSTVKGEQTAVLAGGCFWGVEAVFEHVKGVTDVTSGYSGGAAKTAHYRMIGTGKTGHAEAVKVRYDPSQVSYEQLLKVFFSVAHDPTELNRQGPDVGTQYRSAIFYSNEDQKRIAQSYIAQLNENKVFARPVVTQLVALESFYEAEAYHQDYLAQHPDEPYIVINDAPKIENLRKQLPELYRSK